MLKLQSFPWGTIQIRQNKISDVMMWKMEDDGVLSESYVKCCYIELEFSSRSRSAVYFTPRSKMLKPTTSEVV
jgi:hypothetical protein